MSLVEKSRRAQIILLNGAGSSGKSTVARALQEAIQEPYLHVSLDTFLDMVRREYLEKEGILFINKPLSELPALSAETLVYNQIVSGFHRSIASLAETSNLLIVDHVLTRHASALELLNLLVGFSCLFVGVHCPLEQIKARELTRGDRPIGLAELHLQTVHKFKTYDLEIDTCENDLASNVYKIQRARIEGPFSGISSTIKAINTNLDQ